MKRFFKRGIALPLLLAAAIGVTLPGFMLLVKFAGVQIPQPNLERDYLVGLCWALLLGAGIFFWPVATRDKPALLCLWAAKVGVTLVVMLGYEWNYGLDAFWYFGETQRGPAPLEGTGWGQGTQNMMVIAWVHNRFLLDSFHAMKVSFAMIGLVAIYLIYRGGVNATGREDRRLLLLLGLFPSILFWSSTLGKEPLQLLGVALYVYGVMSWSAMQKVRYTFPMVLGIALATFMRAWYGIIMLVPLAVFAVRALRGTMSRLSFLLIAVLALSWATQRFAAQFNMDSLDDLYLQAETIASGWESDDPTLRGRIQFTGFGSMLRFAPIGAFAALFSPLPGQVMNPFGLMAGVENALLLTLLALAVFRADRKRLADPLVQWALVLVLIWAGFHAFVSYYNAGAAVRFRLPIMPVLIGLILYLSRRVERAREPAEAAA